MKHANDQKQPKTSPSDFPDRLADRRFHNHHRHDPLSDHDSQSFHSGNDSVPDEQDPDQRDFPKHPRRSEPGLIPSEGDEGKSRDIEREHNTERFTIQVKAIKTKI